MGAIKGFCFVSKLGIEMIYSNLLVMISIGKSQFTFCFIMRIQYTHTQINMYTKNNYHRPSQMRSFMIKTISDAVDSFFIN